MKLLVNDKEIVNYLVTILDYKKHLENLELEETNTNEMISWILEVRKKPKKLHKFLPKIKGKIEDAVGRDLSRFVKEAKTILNEKRNLNFKIIKEKLGYILTSVGEDIILEKYKSSKIENYVKSIGLSIDKDAEIIRRVKFNDINEDCVMRNTVGNEELIIRKIDNFKPFWFIDSGYTNFLESNKKWHRLVRNHLHFSQKFIAPADRLSSFKIFPRTWRDGGEKILVIEPGPFAASIMHVDIKEWKLWVEKEIRKYSDKKIIFREKAPKKQRAPLYKHLLDEDYYCLININSNAATEAVWAGIPIITLDKHITNPIAKNKISDINDLYKGSIAEWLCMLSYSQFTFEELVDGTSASIIKKYHE